jgi:chromate transporter
MKNKKQVYLKLFTSTFYLSTFTFGGGFVIIPLMKKKFVDDLKWIEEEEMLNLTAIAQSSPGAVAVNASILLGYQVAGITGALVSILGTVLPPLIILSIISTFYTAFRDNIVVNAVLKAMQAGVAAVICDVVLTMGGSISKTKDTISIFVMILAFIATYVLNEA